MRILAGEFSGRRLVSPIDDKTRPMLARVRESLFAILGDVVEEARVLDLFSGTGSLGLEALSRGAATVRFFERDRRAAARLAENVASLGVEQRTRIVRSDALAPLGWTRDDQNEVGPWVQIALMDPPYPIFQETKGRRAVLDALETLIADVVTPGGVVVLHTHPRVSIERDLPDGIWNDRRVYGNTALWFLWKIDGDPESDPANDPEDGE